MKKVYSLLVVFALIGSVNAQVAKHTSKETYSDNSNSGGSRTTYRSGSNSNEYSESTNRQTYKSSSTDYHSESSRSSNENSFYRVDKLESNQPANTIDLNSLKLKKIEDTSSGHNTSKEVPKGGIKKVDVEPQMYLEDKKDDVIVPFNGDSNLETIPYYEENTKKVMPEGLSQNTTTLKNNGIRINGVIVTCDDFGIGRNRRWEILSRYEMYDLSMVKRCMDNFPKDDRWIITCDEFEKSDDIRKTYLLNNIAFYNLDQLKNCDSYNQFKMNLTIESKE